MIEQIYQEVLDAQLESLELLDFHEIVGACREIMGLTLEACADYVQMTTHRYRLLEEGGIYKAYSDYEIERLEKFFMLPDGLLHAKHDRIFIES